MRCQTIAILLAGGLLAGTAAPALGGISLTQERKLGERFSLMARASMPLIREPRVGTFVGIIGHRILAQAGQLMVSYRFFVVREEALNAFAVPGGYVYINAGVIAQSDSVSELAGVLAHEIVHVHMHHMARQYEKTHMVSYATLLGMLLGAVHPAIAAGAATVEATNQLRYRREFEQEADLLGAEYMARANFDPSGMVNFLGKIERQQRINPARVPPYLLSHPLTPDRIVQLADKIKRQGKPAGRVPERLQVDLERVRALVRARTQPRSKVVARYQTEASSNPGKAGPQHSLGLVYDTIGQVGKARPLLEKAVAAGRPHARTDLGIVLLRLGETNEAAQILSEAVREDTEDAVAKWALGRVMLARGDMAAARGLLQAAVSLHPEFDDAEYGLAECYGKLGLEQKKWYHLGRAMLLRGKLERAAGALRKAFELAQPDSQEKDALERELQLLEEAMSSQDG